MAARYQVTLKSGLPGEIGALEKDEIVDVGIGDREPSVGFQKQAYVLPKVGSTGVPLTTVNVEFTKLKLLRINDRNLVSEINRGNFLNNLYDWDRQRIADEAGEQIWKGSMPIEGERNVPRRDLGAGHRDGPGDQARRLSADGARGAARRDRGAGARLLGHLCDPVDRGLRSRPHHHVGRGRPQRVRALAGDRARRSNRVKVQLLARNNEVLGVATTDRDGMAHFDPRPAARHRRPHRDGGHGVPHATAISVSST